MKLVNLLVNLFISLATIVQFDEQGQSDERRLDKQNDNRDEGENVAATLPSGCIYSRKRK